MGGVPYKERRPAQRRIRHDDHAIATPVQSQPPPWNWTWTFYSVPQTYRRPPVESIYRGLLDRSKSVSKRLIPHDFEVFFTDNTVHGGSLPACEGPLLDVSPIPGMRSLKFMLECESEEETQNEEED